MRLDAAKISVSKRSMSRLKIYNQCKFSRIDGKREKPCIFEHKMKDSVGCCIHPDFPLQVVD
jgi:hypothetical protein